MFECDRHGVVNLIRGDDPLDADHTETVSSLLEDCLSGGQPRVVLDMEKTVLIDSAGLELLLDFQEKFRRRGGALKLVAPNHLCREILKVTGVGRGFEIFSDEVTAVGSFAR